MFTPLIQITSKKELKVLLLTLFLFYAFPVGPKFIGIGGCS